MTPVKIPIRNIAAINVCIVSPEDVEYVEVFRRVRMYALSSGPYVRTFYSAKEYHAGPFSSLGARCFRARRAVR